MKTKFDQMSKAEQRVQIAKDVLNRLKRKKIIPTIGLFVASETQDNCIGEYPIDTDQELKTYLNGRACQACALGGLFLCAVDRKNKLKVSELSLFEENSIPEIDGLEIGYEDILTYLSRIFSDHQLKLIESAFERGHGFFYGAEKLKKAAKFAEDIFDDSERMKLIMKNIIANNGTFKP